MGPFPGPTFSRLEAEQPVNAVDLSARDPLSRASGPFGNEAGSLRGKSLQADVRTSPSAWPRRLPCAFVCVCSLGPDSQRTGSVLGGPADAREPTSGFPSGSRRACLPRAFRGPTVGGWSASGPPGPPLADSRGQAPKRTQQPPCPHSQHPPRGRSRGGEPPGGDPRYCASQMAGPWLCPHAHPAGRSPKPCHPGVPLGHL